MKKILFLVILCFCITMVSMAQPKLVGHRGCRFNTKENPITPYYENTITALRYAQSLGLYAAEFDINLTTDDQLVVFHGPQVPGYTKAIQEMSYKETQSVKLPGGHCIPSLKKWLKAAKKDPKMKIIMEIKSHPSKQRETLAVELSMALIKKMKMENQVEYTSFSEWACQEVHRINPNAKVLYIAGGKNVHDADYCKQHGYNGMSYECASFMNNPQLIEDAHRHGIETTMWIINDREHFEWAVAHGVDYITSDHPELIKTYLDELKNK